MNVQACVTRNGWDGVLVDNLLWTRGQYGTVASGTYASDTEMQDDYVAFLHEVRLTGKLMIGNMSNARLQFGRWAKYLAYLDGGWDEWWLTFSDSDIQGLYVEGFDRIVNEVALSESVGKVALGGAAGAEFRAGRPSG